MFSKEAVETLDNLMLASDGILAYRAEHVMREPEAQTFVELAAILAPGYINGLPTVDGWGTPLKLATNRERGAMIYLASAGANKSFEMSDRDIFNIDRESAGENPDLGFDFVSSSADMIQYPRLGSVATDSSSRQPLKVLRLTVVRFGKLGRYIAVQGVVGNGKTSPFPSIEPNAVFTCKENPAVSVTAKESHGPLGAESRIGYLHPGELKAFRRIEQLDIPSLSQPCTISAELSFSETGGPPIKHEVLGDSRSLIDVTSDLSPAAAKSGEVINRVNAVKRMVLDNLSTSSDVRYEIRSDDPTALDITPLPFEATNKGLRDYFERYMSKYDWSSEDVNNAVGDAAHQIGEYIKVVEPGPEAAEWSQFRRRNFDTLKALAQKKLQNDNRNQ
jgi:hypothetical protein